MAVSGVMKPASSIRSTAIRWPSGPTTAIETGTCMASAFSTTAWMNSRHSAARSFAISRPPGPEVKVCLTPYVRDLTAKKQVGEYGAAPTWARIWSRIPPHGAPRGTCERSCWPGSSALWQGGILLIHSPGRSRGLIRIRVCRANAAFRRERPDGFAGGRGCRQRAAQGSRRLPVTCCSVISQRAL